MNSIDTIQNKKACIKVAAFYKFVPLGDIGEMQQEISDFSKKSGLSGTILLANEGINGTIAGPSASMDRFFTFLAEYPAFKDLGKKISYCEQNPFYRMKVRLKKEIVTLGVEGVDPGRAVGEYVKPEDWNDLISQQDVRLIDTRNDYEVGLGTFAGAENPETGSFRDFPDWVDANLDTGKDQKIAMFCTGGIRCEKSTAYLKELGYKNVYHLEGGILNYLKNVPADKSMWRGDCFVFDNRVTVDHNLTEGHYELCPACRMPLSAEDRKSPEFEQNVSCPKCIGRLTPERRASLEERGRQIELAAARGEKHIGSR